MRVLIIGGGPAGMLAGISSSQNKNNEVVLIDKNEKLGKKLFLTGKGRCNVTNNCDNDEFFKNIISNSKFMYSSFNNFNNHDFMKLLNDNGCKLKVERGNRVFPLSDKSYDITDCLSKILKKNNVKIKLNEELIDIIVKEDNENKVLDYVILKDRNTLKTNKYYIDKLIIATGGFSYKSTGSNGDGHRILQKLGVTITDIEPALVPLNIYEIEECKSLQGLALKNVKIKIIDIASNKIVYNDFGEMLFTHFGVSGPIILSASCFIEKNKKYELNIDFKPALSEEQIDNRLIREFENNINKNLIKVIENLLPKSLASIFIKRLAKKLNISDNEIMSMKINSISKLYRQKIIELLKNFNYYIVNKRGLDEAIITSGGIDVKEINPKTMESKKIKNLFFAGELIDVHCKTGGFNIQIAASTGYTAGLN